jgi:hypothetical protein
MPQIQGFLDEIEWLISISGSSAFIQSSGPKIVGKKPGDMMTPEELNALVDQISGADPTGAKFDQEVGL